MAQRRSRASDRTAIRAHSAGGVVIRGEGANRQVAVMRSAYGTWVLPKGGVEPEEMPEAAARRELAEEVGLTDLTLVSLLGVTEHEFEVRGVRYRKQVDWYLFLASASAELHADPAEGALDAGWFGKRQALRVLTHADQRRLVWRAWHALRRN